MMIERREELKIVIENNSKSQNLNHTIVENNSEKESYIVIK